MRTWFLAVAMAACVGTAAKAADLTVLVLEACVDKACMSVLIPLVNPMTGITLTTNECALHAQKIAAEWVDRHPPWKVNRLRCMGKPPGTDT